MTRRDVVSTLDILGAFLAVVFVMAVMWVTVGHAQGDLWMLTAKITATDQEADEGYFTIGPKSMIVVEPGSDLQHWMRSRTGKHIEITFRVVKGEE